MAMHLQNFDFFIACDYFPFMKIVGVVKKTFTYACISKSRKLLHLSVKDP